MITIKEIEKKTMSEEKRKSAKNDYFAFYIGRPISYVLTIPFLYVDISPNMISLVSMIPIIIAFIIFCMSSSKMGLIIGWMLLFLWNLLDGVDGNVARYKKAFSKMGDAYDAMSGYLAMVLTFFAVGVAASHQVGVIGRFLVLPNEVYIIVGALSGIFVIFPRLVMHKAISCSDDTMNINSVKNKENYGIVKLIALNLTSISGFIQVIILMCIIVDSLDVFTLIYFGINFLIMVVSIKSVLSNGNEGR